VRADFAVRWTYGFSNESSEYAAPEVGRVDEAAGIVRKRESVLGEEVGSHGQKHLAKLRGQFDGAHLPGFRRAQITAAGEAPCDPSCACCEIHVRPPERCGFPEPSARVSQEQDQGVVVAKLVLRGVE
jgi:hypothetical protein